MEGFVEELSCLKYKLVKLNIERDFFGNDVDFDVDNYQQILIVVVVENIELMGDVEFFCQKLLLFYVDKIELEIYVVNLFLCLEDF